MNPVPRYRMTLRSVVTVGVVPEGDSMLSLTDSCTLPVAEQPLRAAEFDALFAAYLVGLEPITPTRLSMLLAGSEELLGRVRDLAERESACCSFFTFTLAPADDGAVRLDVEVPPAQAVVLAAVAARARSLMSRR